MTNFTSNFKLPPLLCILVHGFAFHAVYSPWVGKWPQDHLRQFLDGVLANHAKLAGESLDKQCWTMGDFNLRGLAEGGGTHPKPGTSHALASAEFAAKIDAAGLRVLPSDPTHDKGGTLDIHIVASPVRKQLARAEGWTDLRRHERHDKDKSERGVE